MNMTTVATVTMTMMVLLLQDVQENSTSHHALCSEEQLLLSLSPFFLFSCFFSFSSSAEPIAPWLRPPACHVVATVTRSLGTRGHMQWLLQWLSMLRKDIKASFTLFSYFCGLGAGLRDLRQVRLLARRAASRSLSFVSAAGSFLSNQLRKEFSVWAE